MVEYTDGEMHPNREDYEKQNPVQGPTRVDFEREKKRKAEVERKRAEREKEKDERDMREFERKEKLKEKIEEEREKINRPKRERRKRETNRRELLKGIEIPKAGIGRIGGTSKRLSARPLLGNGIDFTGLFSGGMGLSLGQPVNEMYGRKSSQSSGGYKDPFSGAGKLRVGKSLSATGSLKGGIFSGQSKGYKDPFAGMGKVGKKKKSRSSGWGLF